MEKLGKLFIVCILGFSALFYIAFAGTGEPLTVCSNANDKDDIAAATTDKLLPTGAPSEGEEAPATVEDSNHNHEAE